MKILYSALFIFLLTTSSAKADVESWYTYWTLGLSKHDHPGQLNDLFEAADSVEGIDRTEIAVDMLGFYWPITNQTILGFVIGASSDALTDGTTNIQLNQYLYGVSAMHFLGNEPGSGAFIRGDMGISKSVLQSSLGDDITSESGTGFLVGTGYGFAISKGSRLMLGIDYASNTIEKETYTSTRFTIGGLW